MDVAPAPAPVPPPLDEPDLEKEVDRIQKTAEKQLASVQGLNQSLVKKIRKSEAQTAALLTANKDLEGKNADLIDQLHRAQEDVRTLSLRETRLQEYEEKYTKVSKEVVSAELAVKKGEANLVSIASERDALQSEIDTLKIRINDLSSQLKLAEDAAAKEKETFSADIEERNVQLTAITKQKDDEAQTRQQLEEQLAERDEQLGSTSKELVVLKDDTEKAVEEAQLKIREAQEQLDQVRADAETAEKDLSEIKNQREEAIAAKAALVATVDDLTTEKNNLEASVELKDRELSRVKSELETVEKDRDAVQSDLDVKVQQATELAAKIAKLGDERDELLKKQTELEANAEQSRKDADTASSELESRSLAMTTLESEKNLLTSEKESLEKDFSSARDRSTALEREKSLLEQRVYDLEKIEEKLKASILSLETDIQVMKDKHEEDLRDAIAEKEKEYLQDTAELRKELEDVVDRHAAMHLKEIERDTGAEADATVVTEVSPEVDKRIIALDDGGAGKEEGATIIVGPEVPMEVPEAPTPFVADDEDEGSSAPMEEPGVAVMTRDAPRDSVDEETHEEEAVEGDTIGGIISEEVVEEVVVDTREGDDDVLEEVDDEVPVPAAEAALAIGVKAGDFAEDAASKTVNVAEAGVDATAQGVNTASETIAGVADNAAKTTAATVGKAASGVRDTGVSAGSKAKRSGSSLWKRALCCVGPQDAEMDQRQG